MHGVADAHGVLVSHSIPERLGLNFGGTLYDCDGDQTIDLDIFIVVVECCDVLGGSVGRNALHNDDIGPPFWLVPW